MVRLRLGGHQMLLPVRAGAAGSAQAGYGYANLGLAVASVNGLQAIIEAAGGVVQPSRSFSSETTGVWPRSSSE